MKMKFVFNLEERNEDLPEVLLEEHFGLLQKVLSLWLQRCRSVSLCHLFKVPKEYCLDICALKDKQIGLNIDIYKYILDNCNLKYKKNID